jgi:hypothetical protein
MPDSGAMLASTGPRLWSLSSIAAASALVTIPVATPCRIRAASTHASPSAARNSASDRSSPTIAMATTGRRPM